MSKQQPDKQSEHRTNQGVEARWFQAWYSDGGFWSDFGYDGLSVVFDVPLDALQTLPEEQKRSLMRLLRLLAESPNSTLHEQVVAFAQYPATQRLGALLSISAELNE